jgi:hypothetical protein
MAAEQIGTGQPDGILFTRPATAATATSLTYDGAKALSIYTTCASTNGSTSFVPVLFDTVMTGAGQVGGRVLTNLTINAAAGGWTNASKSMVTYGTSGRTTGLGSAICAEMALSAGTSSGTYAPVEIELVMASGALTGTKTSMIHMVNSGTDIATFQTNGYLFSIDGLGSATAGEVFDTCVATPASHSLRICIDGVAYYIMLTNNVDDT